MESTKDGTCACRHAESRHGAEIGHRIMCVIWGAVIAGAISEFVRRPDHQMLALLVMGIAGLAALLQIIGSEHS